MESIVSTRVLHSSTQEYSNDITEYLNSKLKPTMKRIFDEGYHNGSYMLLCEDNTAALRFPGATRGHVEFDKEGVITEVVLYDTSDDVYDSTVKEGMKQFLGMKLAFPK